MAYKKKRPARSLDRPSRKNPAKHRFYTPFKGLDQHLKNISRPSTPAPSSTVPPAAGASREDDSQLFRQAMVDVVPLSGNRRHRVPPAGPTKVPPRFLAQEELEAYAYLVDLVKGDSPFELSYSDEYIDGAVVGLSPAILKKLRQGDFSYQSYLDLHGYNRHEAREVVVRFVSRHFVQKRRCLLIIPGRGLNSKNKQAVLREHLVTWLTHAPLKKLVLAFASARSWDGGAGAFYVLLRRNKGRAPVVSPVV